MMTLALSLGAEWARSSSMVNGSSRRIVDPDEVESEEVSPISPKARN